MFENFGYFYVNWFGQVKVGMVGNVNLGVEYCIVEGGEVEVKSFGQMLGYFKNEEKIWEDVIEDGFLKIGDMGEIDSDGCLCIIGWVKDLFKILKGKYVVLVLIESCFNYFKVEVVCVVGVNQFQLCVMVLLLEEVWV